jgi:hypothetical protein
VLRNAKFASMSKKVMLVWLHEGENLWYTTAPEDEFLLELFGTDTVPTLFFGTTPLEQVLIGLRAANPNYGGFAISTRSKRSQD